MLEQGPDFWCLFDTTQFSYIPLCSTNTCKYVFNPNVTTFQSNCAQGLHFSAFIITVGGLCVCVYVCVCVRSNLPLHTLESQKRDTNGFITIQELFLILPILLKMLRSKVMA